MFGSLNLLGEAARLRDLARHVRRMAFGLTQKSDQELLVRCAAELDERADRMEAEACLQSRTVIATMPQAAADPSP